MQAGIRALPGVVVIGGGCRSRWLVAGCHWGFWGRRDLCRRRHPGDPGQAGVLVGIDDPAFRPLYVFVHANAFPKLMPFGEGGVRLLDTRLMSTKFRVVGLGDPIIVRLC
jgi:hypothetical protein